MLMKSLIFCCFEEFLAYIPAKFHCCQTPNSRITMEGEGVRSLSIMGVPDPVQDRVKLQFSLWKILYFSQCLNLFSEIFLADVSR